MQASCYQNKIINKQDPTPIMNSIFIHNICNKFWQILPSNILSYVSFLELKRSLPTENFKIICIVK